MINEVQSPLDILCDWSAAYWDCMGEHRPDVTKDIEKVKDYIALLNDDASYQLSILFCAAREIHVEELEEIRQFEKLDAEYDRQMKEPDLPF